MTRSRINSVHEAQQPRFADRDRAPATREPAPLGEDRPVATALETLLADELEERSAQYTDLVLERIRLEIPELVQDADHSAAALEATRALLAEFAAALRLGIEHARFHAPTAALGFTQLLARQGVPLTSILRSYRLGQALVFERAARLSERLPDDADRVAAIARIGALTFAFADGAMSDVTHEYEAERELAIRGAYARRAEVVRDLLSGRSVDPLDAERVLAHRLDGRHRALVVWSAGEPLDNDALAGAARPVTRALGQGRQLVIPDTADGITIWVTPTGDDPREAVAALPPPPSSLRIAIGAVGSGPEGFAATKRQADLARGVVRLGGRSTITWYPDVALAAVLLRDRDTARAFAAEELRELLQQTRAAAGIRATLSAYFAVGADQTRAATALTVHRNTIAKRLQAAEALIGHPLTERTAELQAALVIVGALTDEHS